MILTDRGSTLWLLRHDIKLAGRELRAVGRKRGQAVAIVLLLNVLLFHVSGFFAAPELARLHDTWRADALLAGSVALAGAFTLFISKAISEATDALFQRGDLDLLLSSPLPMRRVLTTRLIAIAIIAGFLPLILIIPIVNGMMLRGYFQWAGAYPVLGALALTAAAAGSALTFGLLASVGPRWTRFAARALATLFGALSFLSTQARFMLSDETRAHLWALARPEDGIIPPGAQWWPARAVLGEPIPMLVLAGIGTLAVMATAAGLGQAYGTGVIANLALGQGRRAGGVAGRFNGGTFRALAVKEWRLLIRLPGLAAQVFYQFVFLVPGAVALSNVGAAAGVSAGGVVFLNTLMTGRMAKLFVTGPFEKDYVQALAATSPVSAAPLLRAKLLAVCAGLLLVTLPSMIGIAWYMPKALPAALLSALLSATTRIRLAATRPSALRRAGLSGRMPASSDGLLGVMIDIAWGIGGLLLTFIV